MFGSIKKNVGSAVVVASVGLLVAVAYLTSTVQAQSVEKLLAGQTVSGVVTNAAGKPAANIPVKIVTKAMATNGPARRGPNDSPTGDSSFSPEATPLQKSPGPQPGEKVVKQMTTDAAGKFNFTGIEPGDYSIIAGSGNNMIRQEFKVPKGSDVTNLTVKLPK